MGRNSHNASINEDAKPFSKSVTHDRYDIAVGLKCADCLTYFNKRGVCKCPKKTKK